MDILLGKADAIFQTYGRTFRAFYQLTDEIRNGVFGNEVCGGEGKSSVIDYPDANSLSVRKNCGLWRSVSDKTGHILVSLPPSLRILAALLLRQVNGKGEKVRIFCQEDLGSRGRRLLFVGFRGDIRNCPQAYILFWTSSR